MTLQSVDRRDFMASASRLVGGLFNVSAPIGFGRFYAPVGASE